MKLLSLTSRYYFLSIVIILSIGGVFAYYIIKNIVNHEFNEKLLADRQQFLFEWHTYEEIQEVFYLNVGDRISIKELPVGTLAPMTMRDTLMWDDYEKRILPFRVLRFSDQLDGKNYSVSITKSLLPNEDLITGISEIILLLMGSIIVTLLVVNRQISKRIWSPFYETIAKLKKFKISTTSEVNFEESKIFEFEELNDEIKKMLDKSQADYNNLKEFTENASHEIQTPLAIIKSKSELLLQDGNLPEEDLDEINKINEAANRLSKLNTDLILLTQMENHQFEDMESIDLVDFIENKLTYFEELIDLKKIYLKKSYEFHPVLKMNSTLAFLLINNLLKNAIRHNVDKGYLRIYTFQNRMVFENSGHQSNVDPQSLFQRFKKGNVSHDSSGLGLALIKKVCDIHQMTVTYTVQEVNHKIEIHF
ncbi:Signal transduction histidine kinase [Reichenbachiella faecimaris]|uniref:histidine kinase n=1 Tax=Reichenbachiella faecimaris TaxID=692418 RepID=A0A1W2G4P1_REIFA|nr:HAMP domain-containing sensor histidine kinase [Reichenbachiella faecimaris]SMD31659.1 Signal transduction histidine kinase [Reichenbachiella faecimaris]